jgi:hypothetical protein
MIRFMCIFLDEGRPLGPLGRPRPNATRDPLSQVVVVFPTVQTDGPVVLAPFDGASPVFHIDNHSTCDATGNPAVSTGFLPVGSPFRGPVEVVETTGKI